MSESFWDYIFRRRQPGANAFGDFIRLIRRGTIARPREVEDLLELKALLRNEGVDIPGERVTALWRSYMAHVKYKEERAAKETAVMPPPEDG